MALPLRSFHRVDILAIEFKWLVKREWLWEIFSSGKDRIDCFAIRNIQIDCAGVDDDECRSEFLVNAVFVMVGPSEVDVPYEACDIPW